MKRRLLSLLGAIVLAALPADYMENTIVKNTLNLEAKIINPSFAEAKKYPNLRQKYLDNLLRDTSKFIEDRDCIEKIIYDPEFKLIYGEDNHPRKENPESNVYINEAGYGENSNSSSGIMCVPMSKEEIGKKAKVHVGKLAFEYFIEEDILSMLDNESFSAKLAYKKTIPELIILRPDPKVGKPSKAYQKLEEEILSYELQFSNIENRKRKVSKTLLNGAVLPARKLMMKLHEIAVNKTTDSHYAIGLIATLERRPTIKYLRGSN